MARFNSGKYNRKSIRKKGYDYSSPGAYFITIDVNHKLHLFGEVKDGIMIKNDAAIMIEKWYNKIPEKFPAIIIHEMVIMPNHMHFIIESVVADPRVCHDDKKTHEHVDGRTHGGGRTSISEVIQWFKTMTTNEYIHGVKEKGWQRFEKRLWQRNFYDIIIHNKRMYDNMVDYIRDNPAKWDRNH